MLVDENVISSNGPSKYFSPPGLVLMVTPIMRKVFPATACGITINVESLLYVVNEVGAVDGNVHPVALVAATAVTASVVAEVYSIESSLVHPLAKVKLLVSVSTNSTLIDIFESMWLKAR